MASQSRSQSEKDEYGVNSASDGGQSEEPSALQNPEEDHAQRQPSLVAEKDQQIEALSRRLAEVEGRLAAITSSTAWRILSRYGRLKHRYLLPIYRLFRPRRAPAPTDGLRVWVETKIPDRLSVGKGTALYLSGWCYHPALKVKRLQVVLNGVVYPLKGAGAGMRQVVAAHFPQNDPMGHSYHSGFWTFLPIPAVDRATGADLAIQATLSDGKTVFHQVKTFILEPASSVEKPRPPKPVSREAEPLVAICMTTYNPPIHLFARQIESILQQTHTRWICIINDDRSRPEVFEQICDIASRDPRFHVYRAAATAGFYRNFETCLSRTPDEADFVALCDQDDYWHPDKLEALLAEFSKGTTLVYSDMNIVDAQGNHIAATYWTTRRNNYKDLASLIFANTITGAASMARRTLLDYVLPFPQGVGEAYHDHWIACVALAMGEVEYVDRPLYDYVQHSANVLGHFARDRGKSLRTLLGLAPNSSAASGVRQTRMGNGLAVYFGDLMRLELICRVLLLRCGPQLIGLKRQILSRIAGLDESAFAFAWLWMRRLKNLWRQDVTLGAESALIGSVVWSKYSRLKGSFTSAAAVSRQITRASETTAAGRQALPAASAAGATSTAATAPDQPGVLAGVELIRQKIAPLRLRVSAAAPRRVNLLIPTVDLKHFFGGYITKFNFARRLSEAGFNVRIIAVDFCDYAPERWNREFQAFPGLERLLDRIEITCAFDRAPLDVSAADIFIATTWWTAHIAHRAAKELRKQRFLYLVQEYEPFTFPMGTFASLAAETYSFPHYAIFSTELLRDYFRKNGIGVFAHGRETGDADSVSFQNTITAVGEVKVAEIAGRAPKRLLFYARPEAHAARNMFEMAVLGLSEAIRAGAFAGDWEFYGIGTVGDSTRISLADGISMQLLPRQNQAAYRDVLRSHDLGLSLMYTPHPSLVPIEMASAGMLVVTNTYANKTTEELAAISTNIIAVEPTVGDLTMGLREAAANIEDYDRRVRGSNVDWSTNWDQAFNQTVWAAVERFIEAAGA